MTLTVNQLAAVAAQPVAGVRWVPRDHLHANDWNPNRQAPPEFKLLKVSLLENGWTQPIVARPRDGKLQIVDGYHRWLLTEDREVAALTAGLVPVVVLPEVDEATARAATVRHNRARGTHGVLPMADIVAALLDLGLEPAEIQKRLGMDAEEVDRLADRGVMVRRGRREEFNRGWTV